LTVKGQEDETPLGGVKVPVDVKSCELCAKVEQLEPDEHDPDAATADHST
jgi:predicted class III extradiol MEMO1 family dioxygenase